MCDNDIENDVIRKVLRTILSVYPCAWSKLYLIENMGKGFNIVYGNIINRKRKHRDGEIVNGNIIFNIIF